MTIACNACGQQWSRHPALAVECPQCGAAADSHCIRPSGHSGPFVQPHAEREQLAVDRGLLALCPEGPTMRAARGRDPQKPLESLEPLRPLETAQPTLL